MATHSSILAWRIPMDGGVWHAAVSGVAKSQTRLKQLNTAQHSANTLPFTHFLCQRKKQKQKQKQKHTVRVAS